MPEGNCDPASRGLTVNYGRFEVDNGNVVIEYEYGWDGVSQRPDCIGPLERVWGRNTSGLMYYVHFQGRRGTWRRVDLAPGATPSYTRQQLRQQGFEDNTDLEGLYITTDPAPPTVT